MSGGIDFLLERRVAAPELRSALATALGVADVEVVQDLADLVGNRPAYAVVYDAAGDFALHVSLDPRGDLETVRAVAAALGTAALAPDDSPNPYTWILVRPDGSDEPVSLQPDALDDDEYRLATS